MAVDIVRDELFERLNQVVCDGAAYGAVIARDRAGGASSGNITGGGGGVDGCRTMALVLLTLLSVALRGVCRARGGSTVDACRECDREYDEAERRGGGGGTVSMILMDGGGGGGGCCEN